MKISLAGVKLIKEFEGCRLSAYLDSGGVPTIGYGHIVGVAMGDTITQSEAELMLIDDLAKYEECVSEQVDVDLEQPEFDALVSFAFNLGCNALRNSTLLKLLNAGDKEGAAKQFGRWNKVNGQVLAGLTRRRKFESEMFGGAA